MYALQIKQRMFISSIKNLLSLRSNFNVKFVMRKIKSVAHLLGKAVHFSTRRDILYLIPLFVLRTL
jgi:hypothetical protein